MFNTWNKKIDIGATFVNNTNELTVNSILIHFQAVPEIEREVTEM